MAIATPVPQMGRPEELVLQVLEGGTEVALPELLLALNEHRIADSVIKTAVWELITHRVIELTSERRLRVLHKATARAATV